MANSATSCQKFVAQAIQNVRDQFPQAYTDDILLTHKNEGVLFETYGQLQQSLTHAGLVVAPEKVQRHPLFQYLDHMLYPKEIKPQKLEIGKVILQNDFQTLLQNIQWLKPHLKFHTRDLEPLSEILKGSSDLNFTRQLSETSRKVLYRWNMQYINNSYIILIVINFGKHVYYLQNLLPPQYHGKMVHLCGYISSFCQSTY